MFLILGIVLCFIAAVAVPPMISKSTARRGPDGMEVPRLTRSINWGVRVVTVMLGFALLASTSYVQVGDGEIAQMKRIYLASDLPPGRIIGLDGQKGRQAKTYGPGFHIVPGLNLLNDVEAVKMVVVPPGHYATLSANDGKPMPSGMTYAPSFQNELVAKLDAETFLRATAEDTTYGYKGPQTTVLTPGTWRINTYLWTVGQARPAVTVEEGTVAVIKSNAKTAFSQNNLNTAFPESCDPKDSHRAEGSLTTPLVAVGCIGIWDTALEQGQYYINQDVFSVTAVPIRVQAWEYEGGFKSRSVSLSVDSKGEITQEPDSQDVPRPEGAVADAVNLTVNGYTINQGLRILVQVAAKDAPFIVASVGGLDEVQDRIVTPTTQSVIRDLAGAFIDVTEPVIDKDSGKPVLDDQGVAKTRQVRRPLQPMDLIDHRDTLQAMAQGKIQPEGEKAGVTVREVRFLRPDIPPEVLIPLKRTQLAFAMIKTMEQEQAAQEERIEKEQAAATADKQPDLVKAQIAVNIAEEYEKERQARGRADRDYLVAVAEGQRAQATVLGEDAVMKLKMFEALLETVAANPDLVKSLPKLPDTVVFGEGGGLDALGAMFKRGMERSAETAQGPITLSQDSVAALASALRNK